MGKEFIRAQYIKNYSDEIKNIISTTILAEEQNNTLKECLFKVKPNLKDVFEDMYKLFINNLSCNDIGKVYGRNERTIQYIFKNLNLERSLYEAQKIAVKKRNYVNIRRSYKKTMFNRLATNQLFGSSVENVIRYEISEILREILPDNYEVIVGINTLTTVGELDIPIVILNGNKHYKFGIEVDGALFHQDKEKVSKDLEKDIRLSKLGYMMFRLETKAYYKIQSDHNLKYYAEIKSKLIDICNSIQNIILNNKLY